MKKRILFTPAYVKKFKCIAGECEDSCCIGWNISIDKKTYKKYKKVNGNFGKKLDKFIKRNRKINVDSNYAKINLDNNKKFPFLDKDKLCEVYKNCGESMLSNTCTFYPRVYNIIDNIVEKSLMISCPLAAKLVLLNEKPMEFDEIELNESVGYINNEINTNSILNPLEKYFWDIRIFSIDLLQNRNYSIDERLIILGLCYQKIDEVIKQGNEEKIKAIIEKYNKYIDEGVYKEFFSKIPSNNDKKIMLLKQVTECNPHKRLNKYYDICLAVFNLKELDNKKIINKYYQCYEKYYNNFIKENEYILENYLVNYFFQNLLPYSNEKDILDKYIIMVIFYSIIKVQLIGLASYYKDKFSLDRVIEFIQTFTKVVDHNSLYINYIKKEFKKNKLDNMACMTILIKD